MIESPIKILLAEADSAATEYARNLLSPNSTSSRQVVSVENLSAALKNLSDGKADFILLTPSKAQEILAAQSRLESEIAEINEQIELRAQARTGELAQAIEDLREQVRETQFIERQIRQQNRELSILNSIPTLASSSLDLTEILMVLKHQFSAQLGIPGGCIFTYDQSQDEFRLEAHWGIPKEIIPRIRNFRSSLLPANEVIKLRRPVLFSNVRKEPLYINLGFDQLRPDWQSYLCVPLLADGAIQGIVSLFGTTTFDEAQIAFFTSFGRQMGVAFHHARLFEQIYAARERTQVLSQRLVQIQEAERRLIARELHDEIGQILTGLKLILEMSTRLPVEESRANIQEAQGLVSELMSKVRQISLDLRPAMLDDLGLLPALLWYFERYTSQTKVKVNFTHHNLESQRFNSQIETAAYRIIQEALTNVARHTKVTEVNVNVWSDPDILYVEIEDEGSGFNPQEALQANNSSGVAGMGERAKLLGGGLTIESVPGQGTRIIANLPI